MCYLPALWGLKQTRAQQLAGQALASLPREVLEPGTNQQDAFYFLYLANRIVPAKNSIILIEKKFSENILIVL